MNSTKSRLNQGIAFEPALLPAAKEKAKKNRQSLSAYICSLIAADVGCQLPLPTEPAPPGQPSAEHPGHPAAA